MPSWRTVRAGERDTVREREREKRPWKWKRCHVPGHRMSVQLLSKNATEEKKSEPRPCVGLISRFEAFHLFSNFFSSRLVPGTLRLSSFSPISPTVRALSNFSAPIRLIRGGLFRGFHREFHLILVALNDNVPGRMNHLQFGSKCSIL